MKTEDHDLNSFLRATTNEMAHEYERIQKRAREDPGTAGDQGEENWATLLRSWLPSNYQVVTKGRILGVTGVASPQVDVLVLYPCYPAKLLDKKLYLASGVAAAFECKITLRAEHIVKAMDNAVRIRRVLSGGHDKRHKVTDSPLSSPLLYGLLAHSQQSRTSADWALTAIGARLREADHNLVQHPSEMLELVCVADYAVWSANRLFFNEPLGESEWAPGAIGISNYNWGALIGEGPFISKDGDVENFGGATPIGIALCYLWAHLGRHDSSISELANYFAKCSLSCSGLAEYRVWYDSDVDRKRP